VGRHVIPSLIARGHRVRALVRPGSEAKTPRGCETIYHETTKDHEDHEGK